jgi:hypothetical protein
MEELHTDSIDGGSETIYRPGHVPGRGRTPTLPLAGSLGRGRQCYSIGRIQGGQGWGTTLYPG